MKKEWKRSAANLSGVEGQQDYPLEPVPKEARHSDLSLYFVLLGFTFFTATMFAGGKVGVAFPFWPHLLVIILVANFLLAAYAAVLAVAAYESGLPTALMARYCFGQWGSRWSDILLGFTQIGWYAWGTGTVAQVSIELLGLPEAWRLPLMFFFGAFFCLTAYIGYRGLDILARVTVPLMALLIVWSGNLAVRDAGGLQALLQKTPTQEMSWATAITVIVGTFISGATQSTNWTRFAASRKAAIGATMAAFLLGNGLMVLSGAFGALVYQQADIVQVLVTQGIVGWAVVMLFGNIWTTQDNTIYNFSVAGCSLLRTPRRQAVTLGGAFIGTLLAVFGFADALVPFLLFLGAVIPPLGGVIAADFFWVRKGCYPALDEVKNNFCWSGLAAYTVGAVAAFWLPGVAPINGVLVASISYLLFNGRSTRE